MNTMQSVIDPRTRTILTAYGGLETVTTQGVFDAQGVVDDFTKAFPDQSGNFAAGAEALLQRVEHFGPRAISSLIFDGLLQETNREDIDATLTTIAQLAGGSTATQAMAAHTAEKIKNPVIRQVSSEDGAATSNVRYSSSETRLQLTMLSRQAVAALSRQN